MSAAASATLEFDLVGETTDISSGPVYVYGKSGRCWKFSNLANAEHYFKYLNKYPISAEIGLWLIKKYGSNIIKRLSTMSKLAFEEYRVGSCSIYDDSTAIRAAIEERNAKRRRQIISEPLDHSLCITNKNGRITKENPTKWKHTLKPINMIVYSTHSEFVSDDVTVIADIFIQKFLSEHRDIVEREVYEYYTLYKILDVMENELLMDYLTGDRIVYSSPRVPAVTTTRTWNPLHFFGCGRPTGEEFTPLIFDIG